MDNTGRGVVSGPATTNGPIRAQVVVEELEKKLGVHAAEELVTSRAGGAHSSFDVSEPPD